MQRDMDMVRQLLLTIEKEANPEMRRQPAINGVDAGVVAYHLELLKEAGLIEASIFRSKTDVTLLDIRLSCADHEFLDDVRDVDNWRTTKDRVRKVGSWSFAIITEVAKEVVKAKVKALGLA